MHDNHITTKVLFLNQLIAAGDPVYADDILEVFALQPNGNFSMQLELDDAATDGTLDVFYECTNVEASGDDDRFVKPANAAIYTDFAKNSGEGADGRDIRDFNIETCHQCRIGVQATGGSVKIKRLIVAVQ